MDRMMMVRLIFFSLSFVLLSRFLSFAEVNYQTDLENELADIILYIKSGRREDARKKFEDFLKKLGEDRKISYESFPKLSTFFSPNTLTDIILFIERDIYRKGGYYRPTTFASQFIFVLPPKQDNLLLLDAIGRVFPNFSAVRDFFIYRLFGDDEVKVGSARVVINFDDELQLESRRGIHVIDFSPAPEKPMRNAIYFMPSFRYLFEALSFFVRERDCKLVVAYPKDMESFISIIREVTRALGVSISLTIQYTGIDITPFVKTVGLKLLDKEKRKEFSDKSDKFAFEQVAHVVDESGCVFIFDNPKNSAAIIPQFRFIGAKKNIFVGIMWHGIKRYLEPNYYDKVFYVDFLPPGNDRLLSYMTDIKRIADFLANVSDVNLTKKMEIGKGENKIIITRSGHIFRPLYIFQVGRDIMKVKEYMSDELITLSQ